MLSGEGAAVALGVGLTLSLIVWGSVNYGVNPSGIVALLFAGLVGTWIAVFIISRIK